VLCRHASLHFPVLRLLFSAVPAFRVGLTSLDNPQPAILLDSSQNLSSEGKLNAAA
jgi:hypothetical protein